MQVLQAPQGRAQQLNAGAAAAGSDWLLFLHADCWLTPRSGASIGSAPVFDANLLQEFSFMLNVQAFGAPVCYD